MKATYEFIISLWNSTCHPFCCISCLIWNRFWWQLVVDRIIDLLDIIFTEEQLAQF